VHSLLLLVVAIGKSNLDKLQTSLFGKFELRETKKAKKSKHENGDTKLVRPTRGEDSMSRCNDSDRPG
jgi:hypothetical protein